jgi:asparagine synthase (glutamine-hydrolysing)
LLARSAISTLLADRRPPFWGRISKTIDFSRHAATNAEPRYPHWINGRLESSLQLRERWKTIHSQAESAHSIRPKAYASLHIPRWQAMFESFNFGWHKNAFEVRHPFADIRMLRFLLSLPAMPWCRNKYLLRKAMQGRLPNEVLRRRKATPRMDLVKQFMARFCEKPFRPACGINEFVDPKRFAQSLSFEEVENNLRVRSLNHWLQNLYDNSHNSEEGIARERNA